MIAKDSAVTLHKEEVPLQAVGQGRNFSKVTLTFNSSMTKFMTKFIQ